MSWRIEPIADEATKTMDVWAVVEIPMRGLDQPWTSHIVGFRRERGRGQVSSPIQAIDPATRRAETLNRTIYLFGATAGLDVTDFWLWRAYMEIHKVDQMRDVTADVDALLSARPDWLH